MPPVRLLRRSGALVLAGLALGAASAPSASASASAWAAAAGDPAPAPQQPASTTTPTPAAPAKPAPVDPPVGRLSDERRTSRWAYAASRAIVYARPHDGAFEFARLHLETEDEFPEVYLLLRSVRDVDGAVWVELRLPGRPNGRTGWVRRAALGRFHVVHTQLVVDRRRLRATLYRNGRAIFSARVGVGKRSTPTPPGNFWIREGFRVVRAPVYGPYAFGSSAYSSLSEWPGGGVVGIHGTDEPKLVPGRPSHGCIRMRNRDVRRLSRLLPVGTPLKIV